MALSFAEKMLARANAGERLKATERRHVIEYFSATHPDKSNREMAELFQVSERVIRLDKELYREQKALFLKKDLQKDLALVIADIAMDFERQVLDIEKSKAKAKLGSLPYLAHCKSVLEMRLNMVKAFQDIGYLPKNLGNMTVEKFEYKATVSKDGAVNTRPVDMFDSDNNASGIPDAEFTDLQKPALLEAAPDVENQSPTSAVHANVEDDAGADEAGSSGIGAPPSAPVTA